MKKTLGQIAYESVPDGGQQNFGPWHSAPMIVRSIHERMAKAVKRAVIRQMARAARRDDEPYDKWTR